MPRPLGGLHYIRCMHDRNRGWPLSRLHKTHTARRVPASLHTSHNDAAVESAPLALGRKGSAAGGRGQARDGWPHPLAGLRIHTTAASGRLSRLCALWHWPANRYRHCRTHCSQGNRSMLGARPQARRLGQGVKLRPPAEPGGRTVHQYVQYCHCWIAADGTTWQPQQLRAGPGDTPGLAPTPVAKMAWRHVPAVDDPACCCCLLLPVLEPDLHSPQGVRLGHHQLLYRHLKATAALRKG